MAIKRELGIARCGLACCLCSEKNQCSGCNSGDYPDKAWFENRKCSIENNFSHYFECNKNVEKDYYQKSNLKDLRFLSKDMGLKNY